METPAACVGYDEELSALLDAELAPEREEAVRAHVAGCARCGARLAALGAVDLALAELPAAQPEADLRARFDARLAASDAAAPRARPEAPPRRRRWRAPAAAAAACAAAMALYLAVPVAPEPAASPDPIAHEVPPAPGPEPLRVAREPAASEPERTGVPGAGAAAEPARVAREASPPPTGPEVPAYVAGEPALANLSEEELGLVLELEEVEDLEVIANLDLLTELMQQRRGAG